MNDLYTNKYVEEVVAAVVLGGNRQAIKYVSPKLRVKATLRYMNLRRGWEVSVLMGRPNYAERKFVALAKKAGEPFPIRKIQVKPTARR